MHIQSLGFPGDASRKEPAYQRRRHRFNPWAWKIPWRRAWQATPVFLPGESHGQRSLVGYSPWGCKESDMTEQLNSDIKVVLVVKSRPVDAGRLRDAGSIPRSRRSPGGGHGNPLQYSCLENPMDKEAWWATVHGVAKSQT